MFGAYRILLALAVVAQHLGGLPLSGVYAVFGFYLLSGYLMTHIVQRTYGYDRRGFMRYAANRALRIFPAYWAACLVALLLLVLVGEPAARSFVPSLYLPDSVGGWLRNILLWFPALEAPRLSPPSWALTVELIFYLAIGLGATRSFASAGLLAALGAGAHALALLQGLPWEFRYYPALAAALPFGLGGLLFHSRAWWQPRLRHAALPALALGLLAANWGLAHLRRDYFDLHFYLNLVLCALAVATLLAAGQRAGPRLRRWDAELGALSYPVYLLHYPLALVAIAAGLTQRGAAMFLALLPLVLLASWLCVRWVERPVERWRARLRPGNNAGSGAA